MFPAAIPSFTLPTISPSLMYNPGFKPIEKSPFGAQYAYLIQDGKLGPLVRDINIMGNLFSTMKNITAISNDFELGEAGGCGKGQLNIKSCHGGPHILMEDTLVGGV